MAKSECILRGSFVATGKWWLPEFAEQPIAGTLEYTNGKISLTTIGGFLKPRSVELGVVPKDFERLPVIHGLSVNGDRFTLLESSEANRTFASHGEGSAEWSATWLLVGVHSDGLKSLKVVELSFDSTQVTSFLCHSHFSTTPNAEGRSWTVNYVKPEKTRVRLESHRATLEFDSSLSVREGHAAVALTVVSPITVVADSPESLTDWFMPKMQQCSRLLALLTDHPISIKWVRVTLENDQSYPWVLYRTGPLNELPKDEHPFSLLFRHTDIQDSFASIVEKWFSTSHVLSSAINLFTSAHRDAGSDLEGRFLTATQSLEAFSRATTQSEYMEDAAYQEVRQILVDAIPKTVSSGHREKLKSQIRYGNEHSLRKRITGLIESLSGPAHACFCKSPEDFTAGVVDTRNYLTHLTDELRPKALTGPALFWANRKILMLLRILLLKYLGISEDVVVARIKGHGQLMQELELFKGFAECLQ